MQPNVLNEKNERDIPMLNKAKTLRGYKLRCRDGEMGKVKEFYFDDNHWTIRYLVADTGNWLIGKQVLISPYALMSVDQQEKLLFVNLTKAQVEASPLLATDVPVSKQYEDSYYNYYSWPNYYGGPYTWGDYPYIMRDGEKRTGSEHSQSAWDPHLRSTHDVTGHSVSAIDGEIGRIDDFLIDAETWTIRYLVVDTGKWLHGRKVLISPKWIENISWALSEIFVNLSKQKILESPTYTEGSPSSRDYEAELCSHYQRPGYWRHEGPKPDQPSVFRH
jgi:uncharacterized protein YrrD